MQGQGLKVHGILCRYAQTCDGMTGAYILAILEPKFGTYRLPLQDLLLAATVEFLAQLVFQLQAALHQNDLHCFLYFFWATRFLPNNTSQGIHLPFSLQ